MLSVLLLVCLGFMLVFPNIIFNGANSGLLLWFQTVLPTLFPFFVMNALLLKSGAISQFSRMVSPVFGPFFNISQWSSYAVLCGFFCGAPIGAVVVVELVSSGKISKTEGEYLLSFCNNTSPGFVVGFVFEQCFKRSEMAYTSLGILIGSYVLSSFLFRRMYYQELRRSPAGVLVADKEKYSFPSKSLDESIWESSETILKIGGYIIIFCVLLYGLKSLPVKGRAWQLLLLPSLEVTNGIKMITSAEITFEMKYVLSMALLAFGGVCAGFQTKCIIDKANLSFRQYIKEKLITAMVTSLFAITYLLLYSRFTG